MINYDCSPHFTTGGVVDSYSLQGAPAWLSIDNAGMLTGDADVEAVSNVTVTAHNADGTAVSNVFVVTATEVVPITYKESVIADSPEFYLRLGEPTGTVTVDEMGNHDGRYVGGTDIGAVGLIANDSDLAMSVDPSANSPYGPGVEMDIRDSDSEPVITVEAWIKPNTLGGDQSIVKEGGSGNGWALGITGGNFRIACVASSSLLFADFPTSGFNVGDIIHIAGVITASKLELYINGVSVAVNNAAIGGHNGSCELEIGRTYCNAIGGHSSPLTGSTSAQNFDGVIDEVAIYYFELAADRILAHYNAGKAG